MKILVTTLLSLWAIAGWSQSRVVPSTEYTRFLLKSKDAETARTRLGVGTSGQNQSPWLTAINGGGFSLTNAGGISAASFTNASGVPGWLAGYDANNKIIAIEPIVLEGGGWTGNTNQFSSSGGTTNIKSTAWVTNMINWLGSGESVFMAAAGDGTPLMTYTRGGTTDLLILGNTVFNGYVAATQGFYGDGSHLTNLIVLASSLVPGGTLPPLNANAVTNLNAGTIAAALNSSVLNGITNATSITFRDGVGSEMATLRGGGAAVPDQRDTVARTGGGGGWYWKDGTPSYDWIGSLWTPASSYTLGSIYMEMGRFPGATGTVRVNVYAVSGGLPTGSPLGVSSTVNIATFASANAGGGMQDATPCTFVFSTGIPLTSGTPYAMVLEAPTFSGVLLTYIVRDPPTPSYGSADGITWSRTNAGSAAFFITYSTAEARAPGQLILYADSGLTQAATNFGFGPLQSSNASFGIVVGNPPTVDLHNGTNGPMNLRVRGGYFFGSNAVSLWPTIPRFPGDVFLGNSNGVQYQLSSGRGDTWLSTNQLGAGPQ